VQQGHNCLHNADLPDFRMSPIHFPVASTASIRSGGGNRGSLHAGLSLETIQAT
jgi:hypothetical protein